MKLPKLAACLTLLLAAAGMTACQTSPLNARQTLTDRLGNATVRYGTSGAVGAGAGYAVARATGNPYLGAGAGALAGLGTLQIFKYGDRRAQEAYNTGKDVGGEEARKEILTKKWEREAIYGLPPEGSPAGSPAFHRRVWVAEREVNGVKYKAGYQDVEVYH